MTRCGIVLWALCAYAQVWATDDAKVVVPRAAAPAQASRALLDFDIPAQPLASALNRYSAVTDRPAVFRSSLVSGRTSSPLRGAYSPEAALPLLLSGTGLVAHHVGTGDTHAFVLKPASASEPATVATTAGTSSPSTYDGLVQATVWEGLCANPQTTPGDYRALLRFQIDAAGAVQDAGLLGSTGDKGRDAAVLQTLHRVHIDQSPPAGLVQPLVMLVLPRDEIAGRACVKRSSR
ncbi:energy transducer TonB [Variovorax sp. LT1R16]|uniref:energy transducer TonB n=1 Tax=Variovorax sp. LT1R16 TaxID=3443728 RepID=UPI003F460C1C